MKLVVEKLLDLQQERLGEMLSDETIFGGERWLTLKHAEIDESWRSDLAETDKQLLVALQQA